MSFFHIIYHTITTFYYVLYILYTSGIEFNKKEEGGMESYSLLSLRFRISILTYYLLVVMIWDPVLNHIHFPFAITFLLFDTLNKLKYVKKLTLILSCFYKSRTFVSEIETECLQ